MTLWNIFLPWYQEGKWKDKKAIEINFGSETEVKWNGRRMNRLEKKSMTDLIQPITKMLVSLSHSFSYFTTEWWLLRRRKPRKKNRIDSAERKGNWSIMVSLWRSETGTIEMIGFNSIFNSIHFDYLKTQSIVLSLLFSFLLHNFISKLPHIDQNGPGSFLLYLNCSLPLYLFLSFSSCHSLSKWIEEEESCVKEL